MFKAELKERWSAYCDTDKLVDDMMALLTKYHHECTEHGVCKILDTYFENKKHLIEMFQTSQNYVGNMRICVNVELERGINASEIKEFCMDFPHNVKANTVFWKYVDEHGKTLQDYSRVGVKKFKAKSLCYGGLSNNFLANAAHRRKFRGDGVTTESAQKYDEFFEAIYCFKNSPSTQLQAETIRVLGTYVPNGRFAEGMKTSRAFNRVCSIHGVDKLPDYNRLFTEYADMVSGLKRKLKFYISLNPLDYLTMSFGNSWSSCHTIDKTNERNMPNSYQGMHCGGTLSYLLDSTSIITYIHTHATDDHEVGKLYRNMFHFHEGTLVQGRIYPQGNDGATDLYKTFRRFMQIELTSLLGLNADEWVRKTDDAGNNTATCGVQYPDYIHFSGCNVSYPREIPNARDKVVHIGAERICPKCGNVVSNGEDGGYLSHYNC